MRTLTAAAAGLVLGIASASASASDDVLTMSGLGGTWAQDCAQPASVANWYDIYAVTGDGRLTETLVNEPGKTFRVSELSHFRVLANKRPAYTMEQDNEILDIIVQLEGDRQRTWSSAGHGGKAYIKDGKLAEDGSETIWFNRCAK